MYEDKIYVAFNSTIKTNEKFKISLRMPNKLGFVENTELLFNRRGEDVGGEKKIFLNYNKEKSNENYTIFEGETIFSEPGYRTFFIRLNLNQNYTELKCAEKYNEAVISNGTGNFWQMFVYMADFETPEYMKGTIWYQIYVDTFCSKDLSEHLKTKVVSWETFPKWMPDSDGTYRNNQFYGGNLKGIQSKLDYLQALSVNVLYLTPIFQTMYADGYSIDSYEQINELIGTFEDLDNLYKECKKRGIKLILDIVPNHSGPNNKLIKECPEMFEWEDAERTKPRCWWGFLHLVKFNTSNEFYYKHWGNIVENIYKPRCDGIRMDVMDEISEKTLIFFFKMFPFICGEVWKNGVNNNDGREYFTGNKTHAIMNYQFGNMILRYVRFRNVKNFLKVFQDVFTLYPPMALDVSPIFLSSHDTARIPNMMVNSLMKDAVENGREYEKMCDIDKDARWYDNHGNMDTLKFRTWESENDEIPDAEKETAFRLERDAIFMQYTFPGVPAIFAGEEVFVQGLIDPFNRKTFPWKKYSNLVEKLAEFVRTGKLREEYKTLFSNLNDYGERILKYFIEIGFFRTDYKSIFSNSRNFELIACDASVLIYKRENLIFIKNWSSDAIQNEYEGEIVFSYEENTKQTPNIIPSGEAVVIKCNN